jgi:hypothetical protein
MFARPIVAYVNLTCARPEACLSLRGYCSNPPKWRARGWAQTRQDAGGLCPFVALTSYQNRNICTRRVSYVQSPPPPPLIWRYHFKIRYYSTTDKKQDQTTNCLVLALKSSMTNVRHWKQASNPPPPPGTTCIPKIHCSSTITVFPFLAYQVTASPIKLTNAFVVSSI